MVLIYIGDVVAHPLNIIVNQSLCTGIFPHRLEMAKVTPLHKNDDNQLFENFPAHIPAFILIQGAWKKIIFG